MINNNILKEANHIDILNSKFDNVRLEQFDKFQVLTLSNNVNHGVINEEVFLQLKIALQNGSRGAQELLQCAIDCMIPWIDKLVTCDKKETSFNLFKGSDEDELEPLPKRPEDKASNEWSKYFNERQRVLKSNLKKAYKFFDLFNPLTWYFTYHEFDVKKYIPTHSEMLEIVKNAIIEYKDKPGRFDSVWFDNEYKYVQKGACLSDVELYKRVMSVLRIYVGPFKRYAYLNYDLSFENSVYEEKESYMFYYNGRELCINYSAAQNALFDMEMPNYDFFNKEFISFLREQFNISYKESLTDDDAIEAGLKYFASNLTSDWESIINSANSVKELKKSFKEFKKVAEHREYLHDGYEYSLTHEKEPSLTISQHIGTRKRLQYSLVGMEQIFCTEVFKSIEGDEVYKELFARFKKEDDFEIESESTDLMSVVINQPSNVFIQTHLF